MVSVEDPIMFGTEELKTTNYLEVIEAETFHAGDPFGRLSGGCLLFLAQVCCLQSSGKHTKMNPDPILLDTLLKRTVWDQIQDEKKVSRYKEL